MATFTVTWDASAYGRLDTAESLTNWASIGATSDTVEPDYFYQGSNCISCQVKTAEVGFECHPGAIDMETTPRVFLAKIIQTNWGKIDGTGLQLRIGSDDTNYYYYYVFDAASYPIAGGWQVWPIDPNISGYRDGTASSPDLANADYFAILSDASATAKAPNLGMDAIDVMDSGTGLTGVGGDGVSTDGKFVDYSNLDEGVSTNRWGIVQTREGVYYVLGRLTIGSAAACEFTDQRKVMIFPDGWVNAGFFGIDFDLSHASTVITITGCTFVGKGGIVTTDTRPTYTVTGTSGEATFTGCAFRTFATITLTAKAQLISCILNRGASVLTGSGGSLDGCTIDEPQVITNVAFVTTDDLEDISNCSFTSDGTGHAIELTSATGSPFTFVGNTFTDYATDAGTAGDRAIFNDTGAAIIINVSGGDTPSIRNGISASTTVNNTAKLTFTPLITGTEVRIFQAGTQTEESGVESSGATHEWDYDIPSTFDFDVRIIKPGYKIIELYGLALTDTNANFPVNQEVQPAYHNP